MNDDEREVESKIRDGVLFVQTLVQLALVVVAFVAAVSGDYPRAVAFCVLALAVQQA